jgi:glycine cleavage system pyridoxal-binding protein P
MPFLFCRVNTQQPKINNAYCTGSTGQSQIGYFLMRYLPKSPADRQAMLKTIGVRSVDDLFAPIPAEYRLTRDLDIPRQMAESEIVDWFKQRSKENGDGYISFLGAGAYMHYRPGHH